jgi:integrase
VDCYRGWRSENILRTRFRRAILTAKKFPGVYPDKNGSFYIKFDVGADPVTGRREQVTKRGFGSATEAAKVRRELMTKVDRGELRPGTRGVTVNELLDLYLDGIDAEGSPSAKTRFDYRHYAGDYVRPHLGSVRVRDLSPEVILAWQRKLRNGGATKRLKDADGALLPPKGLSANSIRLARAPLSGAVKLAVSLGYLSINPLLQVPQPKRTRAIPKHWTPDEAREFLRLMEGDRTWPVWAFLIGTGLRIGELVWLRWKNVDLDRRVVRVVEFATALGHDLVPSSGKSKQSPRTVDIDDGLVAVLRKQQKLQLEEANSVRDYRKSDFVFTKETGGSYHPQRLSRLLGDFTKELNLPRLTAHGLRHTSATLLLENGVQPKVAAERLGHSDPNLFLSLYSHVTPTMQRDAATKMGEALFGPSIESDPL